MPAPTFTKEKITAIVSHAQSAPLQNMAHAKGLSELLAEFAAWADHVFERGIAEVKAAATKLPAELEEAARSRVNKVDPSPALPVEVTPAETVTADQPAESPAS